MSPLARSLLALAAAAAAAAALLQGACAEPQCTTVNGGSDGFWGKHIPEFHLDQTDSITDLPFDGCDSHTVQVGVEVTACDPYGDAPLVELLEEDRRVHIACVWTDGQLCPQGIDVDVTLRCS